MHLKGLLPRDKTASIAIISVLLYFSLLHYRAIVELFSSIFYRGSLKQFTSGEAEWVGLKNIVNLFGDPVFLGCLKTTLITTAIFVPAVVIGSLVIAILINEVKNPILRNFYLAGIFLPYVIPLIAASVVWATILDSTPGGLFNTLLGYFRIPSIPWITSEGTIPVSISMLKVWHYVGFNTIIFLGGLMMIPEVYYESAKIDGAGALARFRHVTVPMLMPFTFFISVTSTINVLLTFVEPLGLLYEIPPGGIGDFIVLRMMSYRHSMLGIATTYGVALLIIIAVITLIQKRFLEARF
jgi:ABC-type sugar transport system permease subunit